MQETISPLDPAGKRLTYTMRLVNPDATFGFPFPPFNEAEYMSELVGEAVRSGRDTYEFSLIGYGIKNVENDRGELLYIWTVTGTMSCACSFCEDGDNGCGDGRHDIDLADG